MNFSHKPGLLTARLLSESKRGIIFNIQSYGIWNVMFLLWVWEESRGRLCSWYLSSPPLTSCTGGSEETKSICSNCCICPRLVTTQGRGAAALLSDNRVQWSQGRRRPARMLRSWWPSWGTWASRTGTQVSSTRCSSTLTGRLDHFWGCQNILFKKWWKLCWLL